MAEETETSLEEHIEKLEKRNSIMSKNDFNAFMEKLYSYFWVAADKRYYQPYAWQLKTLIEKEIPRIEKSLKANNEASKKDKMLSVPINLLQKKYNLVIWKSEIKEIMDYCIDDLSSGLKMTADRFDIVYKILKNDITLKVLSKDSSGNEILSRKGKIIGIKFPRYSSEEKSYVDSYSTEVEFELLLKKDYFPELDTTIRLMSEEKILKQGLFENFVIKQRKDEKLHVSVDAEEYFSAKEALRKKDSGLDDWDDPRYTVMMYFSASNYSYEHAVLPVLARKYTERIAKFNKSIKKK